MAVKKFEHVGIQVKDIEASKEFYQNIVGLEFMDEFTHTNGKTKLAFLGLNDSIIVELIEGKDADFPSEGKVHHIAFTVDGIEQEMERIVSLGVPLIGEEITTLPNGAKYFFFYGPDTEFVEFFEPKN
jgi:lactoylglutathione lyase